MHTINNMQNTTSMNNMNTSSRLPLPALPPQEQPREVFPMQNSDHNNAIVYDGSSGTNNNNYYYNNNNAATATTAQNFTFSSNNHKNSVDDIRVAATTTTTTAKDDIDQQPAATLLTSKLCQLSLEERTQAIHELHGVAEDMEQETPEMVQEKLQEMTRVAELFGDTTRTAAYRKAMTVNPHYVNNKVRLLCLRADRYDSHKAAARMISFLSFKQQLFGEESLTRDIVLNDFTGEDQELLESGVCQLLQQRDRAGRGITLIMGNASSRNKMLSVLRVHFYVHMSALRDEDIQKKGLVVIFNGIGQEQFVSGRPSKLADVWWLLPVRLVAFHMLYDQVVLDLAIRLLSQSMEAHHLCRLRVHKGSNQECLFHLMTFGVSKDVWPFDERTGEMNLEAHQYWLKSLQRIEERQQEQEKQSQRQSQPQQSLDMDTSNSSAASASVVTTSSTEDQAQPQQQHKQQPQQQGGKELIVRGAMDIVVGMGGGGKRGRGGQRHTNSTSIGYMKFCNVLQSHRDEYESAERFEKTMMANRLVQHLRNDGCRFIRCSQDGIMTECTDVEARDKISHYFRNLRQQKTNQPKHNNNQQQQQVANNSVADDISEAMMAELMFEGELLEMNPHAVEPSGYTKDVATAYQTTLNLDNNNNNNLVAPEDVSSTSSSSDQGKEVVTPGPMDIVVGLGRPAVGSRGYMKFRDLLLDYREQYENSERVEKTVLAKKLFTMLVDEGCRFVRVTPDRTLTACSEAEARGKISHTFRNMRQQRQPKTATTTTTTTTIEGRTHGTTKRGLSQS